MKEYFVNMNVTNARTMFAVRAKSLRTIRTHQFNNKDFANDLWGCQHCLADPNTNFNTDSMAHVTVCSSYEHLRKGKNLHNDIDLVTFYRDVIKSRDELLNP